MDEFLRNVTENLNVDYALFQESSELLRQKYMVNTSMDDQNGVTLHIIVTRRKTTNVGNIADTEKTFSFGLHENETFNAFEFIGFETVYISGVDIKPGFSVDIINSNRFRSHTQIYNGTSAIYHHEWELFKLQPMCFSATCNKCELNGTINVIDKPYLDQRYIIPAVLLFVFIIVLISAYSQSRNQSSLTSSTTINNTVVNS